MAKNSLANNKPLASQQLSHVHHKDQTAMKRVQHQPLTYIKQTIMTKTHVQHQPVTYIKQTTNSDIKFQKTLELEQAKL